MKTFEQTFKKDISKVVSWHKDKKGRQKFKLMCWFTYLGLIILLVVASYLFTAAGLYFDESAVGPPWAINWDNAKSVVPFSIGIVIFIIATVLLIFFSVYYPGLYKESQNIYLTTKEYKAKKMKYLRADLTKIDKKELKWLFKLKYVDKQRYKQALENKKKKNKKRN